jgi:amidase
MTVPRNTVNDRLNAFCTDSHAYLEGSPGGPLSGLTFAAKDIFDVAGHVTGGGNPDWKATHDPAEATAWVVQALVDSGATMVGKTITDELTRGIFGENMHYGTPVNPRAPGRVPGGSSSGSASAVAGGLVDFALGSDTGGSVRVPSSFCGLYGLRPTHGRVSFKGFMIQAPSFDTIGWFARDMTTFSRVAEVILQTSLGPPEPVELVIAQDAFRLAEPEVENSLRAAVDVIGQMIGHIRTERLAPNSLSEWSEQQQALQSREAWETARDWIEATNPRFSFEVAERYITARVVTDAQVEAGQEARRAVVERMNEVAPDGAIVCLPTTVAPAPPLGQPMSERRELRAKNSMLTSIAGLTGRPQINLPLAEVDSLPVGLSLIGRRGGDELLISFAREVESALRK